MTRRVRLGLRATAKQNQRRTAVHNIQETALAWALIDAAKPHLNMRERDDIFTTVGAGDTFAAIRHLLIQIAAKRVVLRPQLFQQCKAWVDTYSLHEEQVWLHRLVQGFSVPESVPPFTAKEMTTTLSRTAMSIKPVDESTKAPRHDISKDG